MCPALRLVDYVLGAVALWFHQGARDQDAPFFVDRDRRRPYLYSKATVDIRALWAAVVGQAEANSWYSAPLGGADTLKM